MLKHHQTVGRGEGHRPTGTAFANDDRDQRHANLQAFRGGPRNRLGLAKWIVSDANPLTTRVTVNRMWQELFGTGLVKTSEDFGIMGSLPSHPELLDWLSIDFRTHGWDVKRFYKQLLTSATYRQAALTTKEKVEKDRDNALLSRGPRFRMDAEMLRDQALAVSGQRYNQILGHYYQGASLARLRLGPG